AITRYIGTTNLQSEASRVTLGILPAAITQEINKVAKVPRSKQNLAVLLMHKIAQRVYEEIWLPRCQVRPEASGQGFQVGNNVRNARTASAVITESHCEQTYKRN
ncbi:14181_t:CDS:1, partial [Gigaspora rosea]